MATVQGNLINYNGDKVAPNTLTSAVYDAAKQQALSATLVNTPDKSTLGYPAFSTLSNYAVGDVVYYLTKLWRFVSAHTRGDWNAAEVEEFSIKDLADEIDEKKADKDTDAVSGNVAEFDENGDPVDAGVAADALIVKKTGAVDGNVAQFDENGDIEDAGVPADNLAQKDGYYEQLVAGLAENLVDTKGTGSEQEFTDRTSCGDESIADDGTGVIKELRGNSLAWNQLVKSAFSSVTRNSVTISADETEHCVVFSGTPTGGSYWWTDNAIGNIIVVGHKYLYSHEILALASGLSGAVFGMLSQAPPKSSATKFSTIFSATSTTGAIGITSGVSSDPYPDFTGTKVIYQLIDLTLMFGAGKEPSTVAEFEALYPELYYPQSDGAIINNAADTLVSDGFNQWDEEWELGYYNDNTGLPTASTSQIRSKNTSPIPVFPDTAYCFTCLGERVSRIFWYDSEGNFISSSGNPTNSVFVVTSPSNARYCKFHCPSAYGTTYQNDICVNLSWSGYRNGEYEHYWKRETGVDMRKIYGKLNGAGEMVQVFPAGGRSAGNVFDSADLVRKEADVRVGSVDLGTMTWSLKTSYASANVFTSSITGLKPPTSSSTVYSNQLNVKGYSGIDWNSMQYSSSTPDKSIASYSTGVNDMVGIRDSAYSDAASFKAAMNGVTLNYELATPLHYTDLMYSEDGGETFIDIPSVYKVADFGTERIQPLVDAQGNPVTAPFRAVIQYNDDFTREIVNLPKNYDTTGSIDDLLAELSSVLGTALGGTLTITRGAYNAATKKYAWAVSFAASDSPAENTD